MRPLTFYALALVIVVCDQVSKWAIMARLPLGASIPVLGHFLYLTHTINTGGAFSLMQAGNAVFIVIAVIAMAALIYAYHRGQKKSLPVSAAIALAFGGAIGNLIDRVRFGHVVDFFDLRWWPVFNVADSAITVGIVILAWYFLIPRKAPRAAEPVVANDHTA